MQEAEIGRIKVPGLPNQKMLARLQLNMKKAGLCDTCLIDIDLFLEGGLRGGPWVGRG
jgi:hypothetical protein